MCLLIPRTWSKTWFQALWVSMKSLMTQCRRRNFTSICRLNYCFPRLQNTYAIATSSISLTFTKTSWITRFLSSACAKVRRLSSPILESVTWLWNRNLDWLKERLTITGWGKRCIALCRRLGIVEKILRIRSLEASFSGVLIQPFLAIKSKYQTRSNMVIRKDKYDLKVMINEVYFFNSLLTFSR